MFEFGPLIHGAMKIYYFYDFYGVVNRRIYSNTKYVVYNGCKVGMLYRRNLYVLYGG